MSSAPSPPLPARRPRSAPPRCHCGTDTSPGCRAHKLVRAVLLHDAAEVGLLARIGHTFAHRSTHLSLDYIFVLSYICKYESDSDEDRSRPHGSGGRAGERAAALARQPPSAADPLPVDRGRAIGGRSRRLSRPARFHRVAASVAAAARRAWCGRGATARPSGIPLPARRRGACWKRCSRSSASPPPCASRLPAGKGTRRRPALRAGSSDEALSNLEMCRGTAH